MASQADIVSRLRAAGCVYAEEEAAILLAGARSPEELDVMVGQRVSGLPLEQVVGWAEFYGLRIAVNPGVFVPRRRSEFLVDVAVGMLPAPSKARSYAENGAMPPQTAHDHGRRVVVMDLCCGTGALGVAVASTLGAAESRAMRGGTTGGGTVELHAADLHPAAVACARRNVEPAGGRVYEGDLFAPLPGSLQGRVGILICNAPYVPTGEIAFMPPEARDHEARMALDGGPDGLAVLTRAAAEAPGWLAPGGTMLVETSERQAKAMADAMARAGLAAHVHSDDETGATVVTGGLPLSAPRERRRARS
jgi:release factor glutamine methyltransferase